MKGLNYLAYLLLFLLAHGCGERCMTVRAALGESRLGLDLEALEKVEQTQACQDSNEQAAATSVTSEESSSGAPSSNGQGPHAAPAKETADPTGQLQSGNENESAASNFSSVDESQMASDVAESNLSDASLQWAAQPASGQHGPPTKFGTSDKTNIP
eukprot:GHVT01069842.1.p1 GENE.GHVT01069842.1~~GHVT01069842.1.p1  ORF type:complete len:164 (+),score=36.38 GHVT01069842.1:24-494(+)